MFKRLAAAILCCAVLPLSIPVFGNAAESIPEQDGVKFFAQPTVVTNLETKESIASLNEQKVPNVVWITLNTSMQVISQEGKLLGSFIEIYEKSVMGSALPVVQPQDENALAVFAEYLASSPISDLAIAGDLSLLTQAQQSIPSARLYYSASGAATDSLRQTQLGLANTVGAQVIVLENSEASAQAIAYYQARFKSVWVMTDGSEGQIADAVGNGAYGVISPTAQPVYEWFEKIDGFIENDTSVSLVTRSPFVAAHRGYTGLHAENTIGAIKDAATVGATHVEIDIRFSADKQIVVYHNDNITYNGNSVPVSSLTLSQLQSISLPGGTSEDVIPTIDDVFEAVSTGEMNDLIMIVEFKGREADLVTSFAEKVYEHNMLSRVTVISFFPEQIQRVHAQLPSISTSLLLYTAGGERAIDQAKSVNSGIDLQKDNLTAYYGDGTLESAYREVYRTFSDRGYSLWMWTYESNDTALATSYGVTGITTNEAAMGRQIRSLLVSDKLTVQVLPSDGDTIEVTALTYGGDEIIVPARVIVLSRDETEARAVFVTRPETGVGLISSSVTLCLASKGTEGKTGCNAATGNIGAGMSSVLLVGATGIALKKKKRI